MYMNEASWGPWIARAADRGFSASAISWPFHEGSPEQLRNNIEAELGRLTFGQIVNHYKKSIETLPERPLLIGHSIGGLVVQKLVNDGFARSAVAISSAPAQGVFSFDPRFFRANFPHVNPFRGNRPVIMTKERFHYTFCNTMSRKDSDQAYEKYVVPESRNVPRSTLTSQAKIDFRKDHAPIFFLTGDQDHLTPLSLVKRNFRAYKDQGGEVDFREFSGRSHFICNQDGWQKVADVAFDWLEFQMQSPILSP